MRKIFTLFTLCLLATAAWGQTQIEFVAGTPSVPAGNNTSVSGPDEMTMGGITVKTTSGAFNAAQYRFGKNATTTITSTIGNITKIEFTCTKDNPASGFDENQGVTVQSNNIDGIWEGNSSEITLTSNVKQVRATKIVFTVGGNGLSSPSFSPAAGTYYQPIEVTIKCGTSGAEIYYTTNGNDPTTSSTRFTAPFTLNANTTVKAISAKDGKISDVVSATYEFASATPVANIREYQQVPDETVVVFTNPVSVLVQSGNRMFVKDDTGYALFFGNCGQTYANGDVIPAGFVGTKTTWDGEPELKDLTGFQPKSGNSAIAAQVITTSQVAPNLFGQLVRLNNVTFTKEGHLVNDATGSAPYYCNLSVKDADIEEGVTYEYIEAIVGSYGKENTVYQLLPTLLHKGGVVPPPEGSIPLCELGDVADNTTVTIKNDAIVLGQQGYYLYLKDTDCGYGLAYGACGQNYELGDVIPAGYGGLKTTWDMEPELKELTGFQAAKSNIGGREALEAAAEVITISQVGHETWGHYVRINNVTINTADKTFSDGTGSIGYFDRFAIQWPDDQTKTYTIYAIVGSYKTNYQLLPTRIVFEEPVPEVECLSDLYQLKQGKQAHFTSPLTAIYQNKAKRDLYIMDSCGEFGLVYGDVEGEFSNGDIINDAMASWTTYNDNYQLTPMAETFVPASTPGTPVEPEVYPVEEISQDLIHHFLAFENVTITSRVETVNDKEQTNYYLVDETGEIMLFDRYGVGVAEKDQSKSYDVKGFLTIFSKNRIMEIYPIEIKEHKDVDPTIFARYDVNKDGEISVADVNALINFVLSGNGFHDVNLDGEMGVADINDLINFILNH